MTDDPMIDLDDRDTLEDWMVRYVLGELGDEDAAEMRRVLAAHPALQGEIVRLERTLGLLPYAAVTTPPPHLRARILAAAESRVGNAAERGPLDVASDGGNLDAAAHGGSLDATAPGGSLDAAAHGREPARPARPVTLADYHRKPALAAPVSNYRPSVMRIIGAIAAVLVVALAWDGQRLRQELQLQRDVAATLQQPNVIRQFALRGTGISLAAGTAVLDLDAKRAAVAIRGLPKLPAGQVYRLWARVGDGAVPCGQFNADGDGTVVSQFTIPVDAYTAPLRELFLNVEPAEQGTQPVGRTVMVGT